MLRRRERRPYLTHLGLAALLTLGLAVLGCSDDDGKLPKKDSGQTSADAKVDANGGNQDGGIKADGPASDTGVPSKECTQGNGRPGIKCGDQCVEYLETNDNCGGCGVKPGAGEVCYGGSVRTSCPDDMDMCNGKCVDTTSDPANCGGCNKPCDSSQVCRQLVEDGPASCQCPVDSTYDTETMKRFKRCGSTCVDTFTDATNCGECGTKCTGAASICLPVEGETIQPTCATGCSGGFTTSCKGGCVNTNDDFFNCGSCGHQCDPGESCETGVCKCPEGQSKCDGKCVNTDEDSYNCGGCGSEDPRFICGEGRRCEERQCVCAGTTDCNGECVDTKYNNDHCGECTITCQNNTVCSDSSCGCPEIDSVFVDLRSCGAESDAECRNVMGLGDNCGACDTPCDGTRHCERKDPPPVDPEESLAQCAEGTTCPEGLQECSLGGGVSCIDTQNDPTNCGGCSNQGGKVCERGRECRAGKCVCPTGLTACDGNCVDTKSDPRHCSMDATCGKACDPTQVCVNGDCKASCPDNMDMCDGKCVNTQTDTMNCGGCRNTCDEGVSCFEGGCGAG